MSALLAVVAAQLLTAQALTAQPLHGRKRAGGAAPRPPPSRKVRVKKSRGGDPDFSADAFARRMKHWNEPVSPEIRGFPTAAERRRVAQAHAEPERVVTVQAIEPGELRLDSLDPERSRSAFSFAVERPLRCLWQLQGERLTAELRDLRGEVRGRANEGLADLGTGLYLLEVVGLPGGAGERSFSLELSCQPRP